MTRTERALQKKPPRPTPGEEGIRTLLCRIHEAKGRCHLERCSMHRCPPDRVCPGNRRRPPCTTGSPPGNTIAGGRPPQQNRPSEPPVGSRDRGQNQQHQPDPNPTTNPTSSPHSPSITKNDREPGMDRTSPYGPFSGQPSSSTQRSTRR